MSKFFKAELRSQKTQHPEGAKTVVVWVTDKLKKGAEVKAVEELKQIDPENWELYKKPLLVADTEENYTAFIESKAAFIDTASETNEEARPSLATISEYVLPTPWVVRIGLVQADGLNMASYAIINRSKGTEGESVAAGNIETFWEPKGTKENAIIGGLSKAANAIITYMSEVWEEKTVNSALQMISQYSKENPAGTVEQQFDEHNVTTIATNDCARAVKEKNQTTHPDVLKNDLLEAIKAHPDYKNFTPAFAPTAFIDSVDKVITELEETHGALPYSQVIEHVNSMTSLADLADAGRIEEIVGSYFPNDTESLVKCDLGDIWQVFADDLLRESQEMEQAPADQYPVYAARLKGIFDERGQPLFDADKDCEDYDVLATAMFGYVDKEKAILETLSNTNALRALCDKLLLDLFPVETAFKKVEKPETATTSAMNRLSEKFADKSAPEPQNEYEKTVLSCLASVDSESDYSAEQLEEAGDKLRTVFSESAISPHSDTIKFNHEETTKNILNVDFDDGNAVMKTFLNLRSLRAFMRENVVFDSTSKTEETNKQADQDWEKYDEQQTPEPQDTAKTIKAENQSVSGVVDLSNDLANSSSVIGGSDGLINYSHDSSSDEIKDTFNIELESLNAEIAALQVGEVLIKEHLSNKLYHSCIGYSSSEIKDELISSQYRHAKETGEIPRVEKDYFNFGNYVHALILEPETIETEFVIEPELPKGALIKTEDYKAAIRSHNESTGEKVKLTGTKPELASRIKEFNPDVIFADEISAEFIRQQKAGKIGVNRSQYRHANKLVKRAKEDPTLKNWITAEGSNVHCERSYFWRDEETKLLVKARPDKEIGNILLDVKTISIPTNIKKRELESYLIREIEKRGYHLSAHHYMQGTKAQTFVWLFLNTFEGYEWGAIVQATGDMLELGFYDCREGINSIAESVDTGDFNGPVSYPHGSNGAPLPIQAEPSGFAMKRLENYRNGMEQ
ncbi:PD-(D/E)XK nuclease-like domain-containing protein [Vibrio mediterranei]|uniref:PD-(D/E)XK nuclease-like domain-containing protein n=1 Tax=Vibrio mediterranei TaxID=689 RepID=UPI0017FB7C16|nr:PD-(D/E)XK nuclease-like domain-containing protein [Vibrio mediterranei]NUW71392.1 PD-(D/E)XK nuclease-like domain-containing protein [Vibrio mediterranei]